MKPNKATIRLIRSFEQCRLVSYRDGAGVWTIGWGTTSRALPDVTVTRGMTITQEQADDYFERTIELFGHGILKLMERKPTGNQYGAMLSLTYNIGVPTFSRSTCLRRFNAGDIEGAALALTWFKKSGGIVVDGLIRRREAERVLFLSGMVTAHGTKSPVDPIKSPVKSTTNMAAAAAGLSMAASASQNAKDVIGNLGINPTWMLLIIGLAAVGWIFRERIKKMYEEGV